MKIIVSVVFVFLLSTSLACCKGSKQSSLPSYEEDSEIEAPVELVVDTISEIKQAIEEKTETPSLPPRSVSSLSKSSDDDYDNMRGFDPASEDDMDDNGMSRYMENNDEEGWD